MNALRLPGFFENLGHSNVSRPRAAAPSATSTARRRGEVPAPGRRGWTAGVDLVAYAREHRELARAFESFPDDADALYPGWRPALGVT